MKLRLTRRAARDLNEISDYLSVRNPAAARRVRDELQAALRLISTHPQVGRALEKDLRRFTLPTYPYLIFYRLDDSEGDVEVITIRHAARAPEAG